MLKINDQRKNYGKYFSMLEPGDYFDYAGSIYLKIGENSEVSAFNLTTDRNELILQDTFVVPLYAELTIKK